MTPSKLNVAYSYSWHLPSSDITHVLRIMEQLRAFCIELGCEAVGELSVKPDSVAFKVTVVNAGQHEFVLTFSPEDSSWKTSGWLRVSSFKEISHIMFQAAQQGMNVRTAFAGMEICYRRNEFGVVEVEQQPAFDLNQF